MSKWTEIRDGVISVLDIDDVTETAKNQLTENLINEGMPALTAIADKFCTQIQAQGKEERGWNAIRDRFVLPLIINGVLWGAKLVLNKSTQPPKK